MPEHKLRRVTAWISEENYNNINELMKNTTLVNMKLSKGAIIDIALTGLFKKLENGEDLNQFAVLHLESIKKEGDSE